MRGILVHGALVALCVSGLGSGCKCNSKKASSQASSGPVVDARPRPKGPGNGLPASTEPDPDYEARRDELLRRGDPNMMKDAPVIDPTKMPEEASATDLVKSVSKDVMMVKEIKVDLAKRRLEIPGQVAKNVNGILEFVAVADVGGKAYESLFTIHATAVQFRLALTLLGHEGTTPDDKNAVAAPEPGQTMRVLVRVGDKEQPLSAYMIDRKTGKPPTADLAFQAIGFRDADKYEALNTLQFISFVPHETFAALRVIGDVGNPYAGADQGLGLGKMPAVGSPVTVIVEDIPK
jgi:hypothetical protein